ncbi:MAG: hypothetical protein SVX43_23365 [Cyanobacteriota bacterium]|nr:hypothetical protein [Cyanobacteriota bacterium]
MLAQQLVREAITAADSLQQQAFCFYSQRNHKILPSTSLVPEERSQR